MTLECVSPTASKKSIMAYASWGNGLTCHVLSDYNDELFHFCMPFRKHGTANE